MNSTQDVAAESLDRKVRLKHLIDQSVRIDSDIPVKSSSDTLNAIRQVIEASDKIISEGNVKDRLENTTEVVLDAQLLKMSHELVSKVLMQTSEFSEKSYQNAINKLVFQDDNANWPNLARVAIGVARTARLSSSMLGALDVEIQQPVQKERQQRRRTQLAAEACPETIDELKRKDKGASKVNIIYKQLCEIFIANNRQPVPFFKLIINPKDFMKTVENAFQIAFLVRDNVVAIEMGEDNYPQVRLTTSAERKSEGDTHQAICSLNLKLCRDMIIFYNIKEAMLTIPSEADEQVESMDED